MSRRAVRAAAYVMSEWAMHAGSYREGGAALVSPTRQQGLEGFLAGASQNRATGP